MSTQVRIEDKIQNLDDQAEQAETRAKLLKAQAKFARMVKEQFPNAVHTVQPNGSTGYVDRGVNAQTHGAIRRHTYTTYTGSPSWSPGASNTEKRFGFYYELTTKVGREKLVMTSEIVGWLTPRDIETILDAAVTSKSKSRKSKPAVTETEAGVPALKGK